MADPTTVTVRVTMSVPQALTAAWGAGGPAWEAGLRRAGLVPPVSAHLRWRVDPLGQGYIVDYEVTVSLETGAADVPPGVADAPRNEGA